MQTDPCPLSGLEKIHEAEDAPRFIHRMAEKYFKTHGVDRRPLKGFLEENARDWQWALNEFAGRFSSYAFPTAIHYFAHALYWIEQDHLRSHPVGQA